MSDIFCVQDQTGTTAQLTIEDATTDTIVVGDTGAYTGRDWQGTLITLDFTVGAVNDSLNFCITTMTPTGGAGDVTKSNWPKTGTITWLTGDNASGSPDSSVVTGMHKANAYIDVFHFIDYHDSRGNTIDESLQQPIRRCIVKATDFLDQKYRYKGVKLAQIFTSGSLNPSTMFIDPWITGGIGGIGIGTGFQASKTTQYTQWPRQGVTDYSGDQVFGVPQVIKDACAEAAIRELNGTLLQPDYDPDLVGNGGIVSQISEGIGPLHESRTFDTKLGIGFFPDIPQIRRMLSKAGILATGGGRTVTR